MIFICQLSKTEQLNYYKRIKKALIKEGVYTFDNLKEAMSSKVKDLQGLI